MLKQVILHDLFWQKLQKLMKGEQGRVRFSDLSPTPQVKRSSFTRKRRIRKRNYFFFWLGKESWFQDCISDKVLKEMNERHFFYFLIFFFFGERRSFAESFFYYKRFFDAYLGDKEEEERSRKVLRVIWAVKMTPPKLPHTVVSQMFSFFTTLFSPPISLAGISEWMP